MSSLNDEIIDIPETGKVYKEMLIHEGEFECVGVDREGWHLMKNLRTGDVSSFSEYGWKFVRNAT